MTPRHGRTAVKLQRLAWAGLGLALLAAVAGYHPATAEGEPPRLPQMSFGPMQVDIPAAPAGVTAVLVDHMAVGPASYSSQDFYVGAFDDSQGADDFCIPLADDAWRITNVDVVGRYIGDSYTVSSVKVFFLTANGSLPGNQAYAGTVSGGSVGNAGTGLFSLTLSPQPLLIGGNRCYWLSVQAVQPPGFEGGENWQWTQRSTADLNPAAYRGPGEPGHACPDWAPLSTCWVEASPTTDFTFRLSGSVVPMPFKTYVPLVRR